MPALTDVAGQRIVYDVISKQIVSVSHTVSAHLNPQLRKLKKTRNILRRPVVDKTIVNKTGRFDRFVLRRVVEADDASRTLRCGVWTDRPIA